MQTFFSEDHRLHFPQAELCGGQFVTPFERPSRVEYILRELAARGFPAPLPPPPPDTAPVRAVHDAGFLQFLETAWHDWVAEGFAGEIIAASFPARRMQQARPPRNIDGRVGHYALASETAMTAGTWAAALSSVASAQAAQRHVAGGARAAFALCRPPGHHAARDMYGGYCFLNNAAIAAQMFRDGGAARVAVLDIDFHHGNGTQDIFWKRGDVFFASLHGDPMDAFPFFLGHADETGAGEGEDATANYPMPRHRPRPVERGARPCPGPIAGFGAEALVVSLGVDAFQDDPISFFKLTSANFTETGARIARAGLPTLFCLEGGYAIEAVGLNTVNVLAGFEGG